MRVNDDILLGSDDEKALIKAVRFNFSSLPHLYCTLHIQENVRDYMTRIGVAAPQKHELMQLWFGASGLAASNDADEFSQRQLNLQMHLRQIGVDDKLMCYLIERVCPKLCHNVEICSSNITEDIRLKLWTNNNCESANQ